MNQYETTITRTGSIIIEADCEETALERCQAMSIKEIEEHAQLTSWEASDVLQVQDK